MESSGDSDLGAALFGGSRSEFVVPAQAAADDRRWEV